MTTPTELAALPATESHIERAREAVRALPAKQKILDALLASNPTRGQMVEFLESLRVEVEAADVEKRIMQICQAAGVNEPTSTERMMAAQIGLLQEQNAMLTRSLKQLKGAKEDDPNGLFTAFLGGTLIAATLSR
jgi:hypothetical protein